jgi:hypothetical protein
VKMNYLFVNVGVVEVSQRKGAFIKLLKHWT